MVVIFIPVVGVGARERKTHLNVAWCSAAGEVLEGEVRNLDVIAGERDCGGASFFNPECGAVQVKYGRTEAPCWYDERQ